RGHRRPDRAARRPDQRKATRPHLRARAAHLPRSQDRRRAARRDLAGAEDGGPVIRIAAVGDVHVAEDSDERFEPWIEAVHAEADALLLAGDLTRYGNPAEGAVLARELSKIKIPVVAVLGNHDYQMDGDREITAMLRD